MAWGHQSTSILSGEILLAENFSISHNHPSGVRQLSEVARRAKQFDYGGRALFRRRVGNCYSMSLVLFFFFFACLFRFTTMGSSGLDWTQGWLRQGGELMGPRYKPL